MLIEMLRFSSFFDLRLFFAIKSDLAVVFTANGPRGGNMGDLARRLAEGDQAAFAELYDACVARLHPYLVVRLGSRADADDVVQETFVRLARIRRKLSSVDNLVAYVFAAARNEAARLLAAKAHGTAPRAIRCDLTDLYIGTCSSDSDAREMAEEVFNALETLSPDQREVVQLKHYGEFTLREIATIVGLPQGTVATRYRSAISHLRERLRRKFSER